MTKRTCTGWQGVIAVRKALLPRRAAATAGFVKLVYRDGGKLIGASNVAPPAKELRPS